MRRVSNGVREHRSKGVKENYTDTPIPRLAPLEADLPRRLVLRGGFPSGFPDSKKAGVTLVELLVAVALLSLLMVAFYTVFKGGSKAYETGEERVELIQNARIAFERMVNEIRQALPRDSSANPAIDFWIENDSGSERRDGTQIIFFAPIDSVAGAEKIRFTRFAGGEKTHTLYKVVDNPPRWEDGEYYDPPPASPNPVTAALPGTEGIITNLEFHEKPPEATIETGLIKIVMAVSADPTDTSEQVYSFHAIVKTAFCYGIGLTGGF